jgi:hypothetical protein
MTDRFRATLFLDPPSHHFLRDRLFDPNAAPFGGDQLMAPYAHLKSVLAEHGVKATTIDALPAGPVQGRSLYISVGGLERYRSLARRADLTMSAFFAFECPGNDPAMYRGMRAASRVFRRMYSWSDAESLRPFVGAEIPLRRFCWPQSFNQVHEQLWSRQDRKFLMMMQGNKTPALAWGSLHRERLKAVEYFGRTGEIDLYGREWDQPAYRVGGRRVPYTLRVLKRRLLAAWQRARPDPLLLAARRAWRGPAASKSQTLAGYTFAICFENMVLKGWITEKIFDCFFAGTIPVYWGAPEIRDVIPPSCYVDMREFGDYQALGDHLRSLTAVRIQQYREAARAFLASPAYAPFTKESFAALVSRIVLEDAT